MKTLEEQIHYNFNNEYNCIPVGFDRFSKYYPGLIKGTYTSITGSKDAGKTKFLKHYFITNPIQFVKNINDTNKLDIKIFVYLTKQSVKQFKADLISSFLKRDYNLEIPYLELLSIPEKANRVLTEDILKYIKGYDEWFAYFDTKVEIWDTKKKPSEIFEHTRKWIESYAAKEVHANGRTHWEYLNPNLFVCCMTDSLNSLQSEIDKGNGMGMDLRKSMDKHSVTNMVTLKNNYDCVIVDIHEQAVDQERIEYDYTQKPLEEKLEPSIAGLGDNKTNNRVYDFILGLHNPFKYGFTTHKNYNIARLLDNYRSLKLLSGMFSTSNLYLGLYFNGAIGTFEELPKSEDLDNQLKLDKYLNRMRK